MKISGKKRGKMEEEDENVGKKKRGKRWKRRARRC